MGELHQKLRTAESSEFDTADLLSLVQAGKKARGRLFDQFIGVVYKRISKRTSLNMSERLNAIGKGVEALGRAIDKGDPDKADSFPGYAKNWVVNEIPKIFKEKRLIKFELSKKDLDILRELKRLFEELKDESHKENDRILGKKTNDILQFLDSKQDGITNQELRVLLIFLQDIVKSESENGNYDLLINELSEYIEPYFDPVILTDDTGLPGRETPFIEQMIEDEKSVHFWKAMFELPQRERDVLILIYWVELDKKVIGEIFGVTGARIRQIEIKALVLLTPKLVKLRKEGVL